MNYEKIYNDIVYKRKEVEPLSDDAIYEKHHIIPRSIRPDLISEPSNIVRLTLKEHFICHQLLVRIYAQKFGENSSEHIKMVNALFMMSGYKRYGKMLSANQYSKLKSKYHENIGNILRQAWKNYPKDKMDRLRAKRKINSTGRNNPMFRRSWKEGKTEEELLQHSIKTSMGLRNRTTEQKQETTRKTRETLNKKSDAEKLKTIQKRNASRKRFYERHPEKMLEKGKNISKALHGKRKLFKVGENPVLVSSEDIQTYLNNGWKYSLREPDKNNPAYGRRWMHIKGSNRKEDRIFVKPEDIDYYLDRGYVMGFNDATPIKAKNSDGVLSVNLPFKKEVQEQKRLVNIEVE